MVALTHKQHLRITLFRAARDSVQHTWATTTSLHSNILPIQNLIFPSSYTNERMPSLSEWHVASNVLTSDRSSIYRNLLHTRLQSSSNHVHLAPLQPISSAYQYFSFRQGCHPAPSNKRTCTGDGTRDYLRVPAPAL